ncbi:MAG: Crp/Fnr family transcriptional regulator [Pseudomonadota bacterium]
MRDNAQIRNLLSATQIFTGLEPETVASVARAMTPVSFAAGRTIFTRGDTGGDLYLVRSGRIKVSVLTAEGRELAFAHIEPGSLVGEIAMLDGGERTADATALTAVEALVLNARDAQALLEKHADFAQRIITFLCKRLRETDLQYEGVALHRIETRLARYFVALCRQVAPEQDEGELTVDLGMSQGELALLLGASRPKVNAALSELQSQGVIKRSGNRVTCTVEDLFEIAELY